MRKAEREAAAVALEQAAEELIRDVIELHTWGWKNAPEYLVDQERMSVKEVKAWLRHRAQQLREGKR